MRRKHINLYNIFFFIIFIYLFYYVFNEISQIKKEMLNQIKKEKEMLNQIKKEKEMLNQIKKEMLNMHDLSNIKELINNSKKFQKSNNNQFFHTKIEKGDKLKSLIFKNPTFPGHFEMMGKPGAYLEVLDGNLIIVNWDGTIFKSLKKIDKFSENKKIKFKKIESNFNQFVNNFGFYKLNSQSVRDVLIEGNDMYLSFTNQDMDKEKRFNCFNIEILKGEIKKKTNYIFFQKIFKPEQCHVPTEIGEANPSQSGGRMQIINKDLIATFGDYRRRNYVQSDDYVIGKIYNTSKNIIISKGHRNPQGLYYDKSRNLLLSTEHGPRGGDEINLIDLSLLKSKNYNFGWPISSYGEHYDNKKKEGSPLYKSHKDYGFDEPLKFFVPSIGISEINKIGEFYYFGSMSSEERINNGSRSISRFQLDDNKKIKNFKSFALNERVRDIEVYKNYLILSLEIKSKIAIINTEELN